MSAVNVESGKSTGGAGGATGGQEDMSDLYKVNQVYYRMMPTLSMVSKRTLLVNQPQSNTYVGTQNPVIFNFNTGEFYTAMNSSWLYIQCGFLDPVTYGTTKALISQGNILSLIEEIIFTSASGTEVERQTNKGLHSAVTYRWTHDQVYIDTIGQVQGAPYGPFFKNHDGTAPTATSTLGDNITTQIQTAGKVLPQYGGEDFLGRPRAGAGAQIYFGTRNANLNVYTTAVTDTGASEDQKTELANLSYPEFAVPLDQLLGVFKPYMNCLFPAGLLSGARLEIRWKRTSESLHFAGTFSQGTTDGTVDAKMGALIAAADNKLTFNRIYIVLDAFQLQDNVLKRLNQTAAGPDGLSMLFDTYDHVVTPQTGSGDCECQVSQARSRVVRSFNVVRDTQCINNPYINSFASEAAMRRVSGLVPVGMVDRRTYTAVGGGTRGTPAGAGSVASAFTTDADGNPVVFSNIPFQTPLPDDPYKSDGAFPNTYGQPIVATFQAQLGALFFPQQPISTLPEHYMNAMYMFGQGIPDSRINCSVTYEDFLGGTGYGINATPFVSPGGALVNPTINAAWRAWVAPWGLAVYGALMEKSQALQLSGLPLSNARLLRMKFRFNFPSISGQRQISTFTQFTRVVKIFLGGRVVVRE